MGPEVDKATTFHIIHEQIDSAIAAPKCHKCGCLQQRVEELSATAEGQNELAQTLGRARQIFVPENTTVWDARCYPAIAANAFAEVHPEAGGTLDIVISLIKRMAKPIAEKLWSARIVARMPPSN